MLGFPRSLSIAFYVNRNKQKFPINSLSEEVNLSEEGARIQGRGLEVEYWKEVEGTVGQEESWLYLRVLVGSVAVGPSSFSSSNLLHKVRGKERQDLVQKEVRPGVGELCTSQMVGMQQQDVLKRWGQAADHRFNSPSYGRLNHSTSVFSFNLCATFFPAHPI